MRWGLLQLWYRNSRFYRKRSLPTYSDFSEIRIDAGRTGVSAGILLWTSRRANAPLLTQTPQKLVSLNQSNTSAPKVQSCLRRCSFVACKYIVRLISDPRHNLKVQFGSRGKSCHSSSRPKLSDTTSKSALYPCMLPTSYIRPIRIPKRSGMPSMAARQPVVCKAHALHRGESLRFDPGTGGG